MIPAPSAPAALPRLPASDAGPVLAALARQGGVLAMLTGIEGRFYRPLGAIMGFAPDGPVGQLSGGCLEGDLAHHARALLTAPPGAHKHLRYGQGSPFLDIRLPCGSGVEVTLRHVSADQIAPSHDALRARRVARLALPDLPAIEITPPPRLALFGGGVETAQLAALAGAAGYEPMRPAPGQIPDFDAFTAVALFFHDHHREIAILRAALASPAFWIGAQGSARAQANRLKALRAHGVSPADLARIHGPIGLIPRARDPHLLAISVLAEIAAAAQT